MRAFVADSVEENARRQGSPKAKNKWRQSDLGGPRPYTNKPGETKKLVQSYQDNDVYTAKMSRELRSRTSRVKQKNREREKRHQKDKLSGDKLLELCLEGISADIAETTICIRAGYTTDDIGQFRRAFSKAAQVELGDLMRMYSEWSEKSASNHSSSSEMPPSATTSKNLHDSPAVSFEQDSSPLFIDRQLSEVKNSQRVRDPLFRFSVLKVHGPQCACCSIELSELIEAAHLIPVSENGSDVISNGLPLCPLHHSAFDRHLFAIDPDSRQFIFKDGLTAESLMITKHRISANVSHEALLIRLAMFARANK